LLVLPVYPAAWPQAKKHGSIQAVLVGWRNLMTLYLVRKLGCRYRQLEDAVRGTLSMLGRIAQAVGLAYVAAATWNAIARLPVPRVPRARASVLRGLAADGLCGPDHARIRGEIRPHRAAACGTRQRPDARLLPALVDQVLGRVLRGQGARAHRRRAGSPEPRR